MRAYWYMWDWCETSKTHLSRWALNSLNKFLASCFFLYSNVSYKCMRRVVWEHIIHFIIFAPFSNVQRHEKAYESEYENGIYVKKEKAWMTEGNFGDTNFHHISFNFWIHNSSIHTLPINWQKETWQKNKRGDGKRWKERRRYEFLFTTFLLY